MVKDFNTLCVILVPNQEGKWTVIFEGGANCQDFTEQELEEELERLEMEGCFLLGRVDHHENRKSLIQRELYFRQETSKQKA